MPRSTASRWRAPLADGVVGVSGGDRRGDRGVVAEPTRRRCGATSARLRVDGQQAVELVGLEEPGEHLAVHLDEQRVAAGPGDGGVEPAVETAELGERRCPPGSAERRSAISARASSSARSAAS